MLLCLLLFVSCYFFLLFLFSDSFENHDTQRNNRSTNQGSFQCFSTAFAGIFIVSPVVVKVVIVKVIGKIVLIFFLTFAVFFFFFYFFGFFFLNLGVSVNIIYYPSDNIIYHPFGNFSQDFILRRCTSYKLKFILAIISVHIVCNFSAAIL